MRCKFERIFGAHLPLYKPIKQLLDSNIVEAYKFYINIFITIIARTKSLTFCTSVQQSFELTKPVFYFHKIYTITIKSNKVPLHYNNNFTISFSHFTEPITRTSASTCEGSLLLFVPHSDRWPKCGDVSPCC